MATPITLEPATSTPGKGVRARIHELAAMVAQLADEVDAAAAGRATSDDDNCSFALRWAVNKLQDAAESYTTFLSCEFRRK